MVSEIRWFLFFKLFKHYGSATWGKRWATKRTKWKGIIDCFNLSRVWWVKSVIFFLNAELWKVMFEFELILSAVRFWLDRTCAKWEQNCTGRKSHMKRSRIWLLKYSNSNCTVKLYYGCCLFSLYSIALLKLKLLRGEQEKRA